MDQCATKRIARILTKYQEITCEGTKKGTVDFNSLVDMLCEKVKRDKDILPVYYEEAPATDFFNGTSVQPSLLQINLISDSELERLLDIEAKYKRMEKEDEIIE